GDSLAICEYVPELTGKGWPQPREARAVARSVSAEMHSGFANLRMLWPMNARARNRRTAMTPALESDIERIDEIWNDIRQRFGSGGPWLFGAEYTVADAMYAPVVLRFNTYGARISPTARWVMASVLEDAALQAWLAAGGAGAAAGAGAPPTGDDLVRLERSTDPQLSPDGAQLAFVQRYTDMDANKGRTSLWLLDLAPRLAAPRRAAPRSLTGGKAS